MFQLVFTSFPSSLISNITLNIFRMIRLFIVFRFQKRRRRIDRSMIGEPTNFVHTTHVGSGDMGLGLASVGFCVFCIQPTEYSEHTFSVS